MQKKGDKYRIDLKLYDKNEAKSSKVEQLGFSRQKKSAQQYKQKQYRQIQKEFNRFKLNLGESGSTDFNITIQPSTCKALNRQQSGKIYSKREIAERQESQILVPPQDIQLEEIVLAKQREVFRKNKQIAQLQQEVHILTTRIKVLSEENQRLQKHIEKSKKKIKYNLGDYCVKQNEIKCYVEEKCIQQIINYTKSVDIERVKSLEQFKTLWKVLQKSFLQYQINFTNITEKKVCDYATKCNKYTTPSIISQNIQKHTRPNKNKSLQIVPQIKSTLL